MSSPEVSNLASLHGKELTTFRLKFRLLVDQMREFCDESQLVVGDSSFSRLGLTDAAIYDVLWRSTDTIYAHGLVTRSISPKSLQRIKFSRWCGDECDQYD
jgi:hypothetical protein